MKLCVNCKHSRVETGWLTRQKYYYCRVRIEDAISPVTGEHFQGGYEGRCSAMREMEVECGKEGKFWEAK
jgi:hypothetical protein